MPTVARGSDYTLRCKHYTRAFSDQTPLSPDMVTQSAAVTALSSPILIAGTSVAPLRHPMRRLSTRSHIEVTR